MTKDEASPTMPAKTGKTFLVAVNPTDKAGVGALKFVMESLANDGDTVHCLTCIRDAAGLDQMPEGAVLDGYDEVIKGEETAKRRLKAVVAKTAKDLGRTGLHLKAEVDEGDAVERIVAVAQETKPDLLVLGTHVKGFFEGVFHSSVSNAVFSRSPVPVMIYRPQA